MRTQRSQHRFRTPLERRLKEYSLAAAGIGMVALVPPAKAAVVTTGLLNVTVDTLTPYKFVIGGHSIFSLNNNSVTSSGATMAASVTANPLGTAKIFAHLGVNGRDTLASAGQAIQGTLGTITIRPVFVSTDTGASHFNGSLGTRYLGFSFGSGANVHYGWAEITIAHPGGKATKYQVTVVQGAYETQAGVQLGAGATTDTPSGPTPTPAPNSLWLLALGAAGLGGLELLRRREAAGRATS